MPISGKDMVMQMMLTNIIRNGINFISWKLISHEKRLNVNGIRFIFNNDMLFIYSSIFSFVLKISLRESQNAVINETIIHMPRINVIRLGPAGLTGTVAF